MPGGVGFSAVRVAGEYINIGMITLKRGLKSTNVKYCIARISRHLSSLIIGSVSVAIGRQKDQGFAWPGTAESDNTT